MSYLWSFIVGGAFCLVGQILVDKTKLTPARILVGYVVAGVFLSGIGAYQYIADFAAAGASTPLTGFGHSLAKATAEAIDKDGFVGIFTGGLTGTAGGIAAAIIFGYFTALLFRSKKK